MIEAQLVGDDKVVAMLEGMPQKVKRELVTTMKVIQNNLAAYIKDNKLSGQVLNRKTGNLSRSIKVGDIQTGELSVTGIVWSRAGGEPLKYAAIHEYGGTIPAHDVYPVNKKALAFTWGKAQMMVDDMMVHSGQMVLKHVRIPDVHMPERSYMRTSLAENKDNITEQISDAVDRALNQ